MSLLVIFSQEIEVLDRETLLACIFFLVFIEPMFRSIMPNNLIDGVFTPGSNAFVMKYFVYGEDVTLM